MGVIMCKMPRRFFGYERVVDESNEERGQGSLQVREKTKADPSLRLKNGYGQDDTVVVG
jgi:hypothetical protein